jgi:XTP/dITP diphosphohydrolase
VIYGWHHRMTNFKRLLFGTTNPTRLLHTRALLAPLPLQVLSLADIGLTLRVVEDGATPAENAMIKANAYCAASGIPTLAIDAGLTIAALPPTQQPGVLVRRFHNATEEATDAEMLAYYQAALRAVGGASDGEWIVGVALAFTPAAVMVESFSIQTYFTALSSPIVLPGEPLSSLQLDRTTGKYFAELSTSERFALQSLRSQQIFAFVEQHLNEI